MTWSWNPATSASFPVQRFRVRSDPPTQDVVVGPSARQVFVTGLPNDDKGYTFTVEAKNQDGWSNPSAPSLPATPTATVVVSSSTPTCSLSEDGTRLLFKSAAPSIVVQNERFQKALSCAGESLSTVSNGIFTKEGDGVWSMALSNEVRTYRVVGCKDKDDVGTTVTECMFVATDEEWNTSKTLSTLLIKKGVTLTLTSGSETPLTVKASRNVFVGGTIDADSLVLEAEVVIVLASGNISADERGFVAKGEGFGGVGPGAFPEGNPRDERSYGIINEDGSIGNVYAHRFSVRGYGVGHGGGSLRITASSETGLAYGDMKQPKLWGSGGSRWKKRYGQSFHTLGSFTSGGGYLKIIATETLSMRSGSTISSNGGSAVDFKSTGATGGSIFISAKKVVGAGEISSRGGDGGFFKTGSSMYNECCHVSPAGSGGRIAMYVAETEIPSSVAISASGGKVIFPALGCVRESVRSYDRSTPKGFEDGIFEYGSPTQQKDIGIPRAPAGTIYLSPLGQSTLVVRNDDNGHTKPNGVKVPGAERGTASTPLMTESSTNVVWKGFNTHKVSLGVLHLTAANMVIPGCVNCLDDQVGLISASGGIVVDSGSTLFLPEEGFLNTTSLVLDGSGTRVDILSPPGKNSFSKMNILSIVNGAFLRLHPWKDASNCEKNPTINIEGSFIVEDGGTVLVFPPVCNKMKFHRNNCDYREWSDDLGSPRCSYKARDNSKVTFSAKEIFIRGTLKLKSKVALRADVVHVSNTGLLDVSFSEYIRATPYGVDIGAYESLHCDGRIHSTYECSYNCDRAFSVNLMSTKLTGNCQFQRQHVATQKVDTSGIDIQMTCQNGCFSNPTGFKTSVTRATPQCGLLLNGKNSSESLNPITKVSEGISFQSTSPPPQKAFRLTGPDGYDSDFLPQRSGTSSYEISSMFGLTDIQNGAWSLTCRARLLQYFIEGFETIQFTIAVPSPIQPNSTIQEIKWNITNRTTTNHATAQFQMACNLPSGCMYEYQVDGGMIWRPASGDIISIDSGTPEQVCVTKTCSLSPFDASGVCASHATITLDDGHHSLRVRAVDSTDSKNVQKKPIVFQWVVDTVPPFVVIDEKLFLEGGMLVFQEAVIDGGDSGGSGGSSDSSGSSGGSGKKAAPFENIKIEYIVQGSGTTSKWITVNGSQLDVDGLDSAGSSLSSNDLVIDIRSIDAAGNMQMLGSRSIERPPKLTLRKKTTSGNEQSSSSSDRRTRELLSSSSNSMTDSARIEQKWISVDVVSMDIEADEFVDFEYRSKVPNDCATDAYLQCNLTDSGLCSDVTHSSVKVSQATLAGDGVYQLLVRAKDKRGNVQENAMEELWLVDVTAPRLLMVSNDPCCNLEVVQNKEERDDRTNRTMIEYQLDGVGAVGAEAEEWTNVMTDATSCRQITSDTVLDIQSSCYDPYKFFVSAGQQSSIFIRIPPQKTSLVPVEKTLRIRAIDDVGNVGEIVSHTWQEGGIQCKDGQSVSVDDGSVFCRSCPSGWLGLNQEDGCRTCPAGYHQPNEGETSCDACVEGQVIFFLLLPTPFACCIEFLFHYLTILIYYVFPFFLLL